MNENLQPEHPCSDIEQGCSIYRAAYLQAIQAAYPDLSIHNSCLHNKDGQYNDILIVNDEIIFRFPRYPEGVQSIQNETDRSS